MAEADKPMTSIAFIIYNRPDKTKAVFDVIKRAKPEQLFLIADGPNIKKIKDIEDCASARKIVEIVDWECKVYRNFSDENLGCKRRVSSGIDWVFEHVEETIILEDDILPDLSFFQYCQELLSKFRNDCRVMMISGVSFQQKDIHSKYSYSFATHCHLIWGWATWRRAWKLYDVAMHFWPEIKNDNYLASIYGNKRLVNRMKMFFQRIYNGDVDTWDSQWNFACLIQRGVCIVPCVNLTTNIGFGVGATHTTVPNHLADLPSTAISFPLRHPNFIVVDGKIDALLEDLFFTPSFKRRICYWTKRLLSKFKMLLRIF